MKRILTAIFLIAASTGASAQQPSRTWNPDKGTHYVNPVLNADYSDPDVCRVGDDFYMTSSSFACFPGLQILHSTDLVNWEIIGAALTDYPGRNWSDERPWEALSQQLDKQYDDVPGQEEWMTVPQHGNGVWAPAIRYHDGEFYIYCGDPDRGIFMVKTKDPRGKWDEPVWVVKAKGYIDPCPLWDEDGKAYLSHGCAGSRAGIKSVLFVAPMSEDGTRLTGRSRIVYDGHRTQPTIEGTKFYKRDGYYYIFSPAGGVPTGWQVVLRSRSPWGPYEEKVVMAEGQSGVNGPHQGAWIETAKGEHWFMHFQDKDAYGRVVHLQPMEWNEDGWPVIGEDKDGDGTGEPVMKYRKPDLASSGVFQPAESDGFEGQDLGLQWQWHGVPSPYWYFKSEDALRLYSVDQAEGWRNLGDSPNLLLQKTPADSFTVAAKISFVPNPQLKEKGENCGLVLMGQDYAAIRLTDTDEGIRLQYVECHDALKGKEEIVLAETALVSETLPMPYSNRYISTTVPPAASPTYISADVYLRLKVAPRERKNNVPELTATFWYSTDGLKWHQFHPSGETSGYSFTASAGKWIGSKFGFFCNRLASKNDSGWMQIDWMNVAGCPEDPVEELSERIFEIAKAQYSLMDAALSEDRFPRTSDSQGNLVTTKDVTWWCSGFHPGTLWYIYEYTGDETYRDMAWKYTRRLETLLDRKCDHDIGFQINCSYGNALRLTGDSLSIVPVYKAAAYKLAERFTPETGVIKSWNFLRNDWRYPVIIDNMMNLELLTRGSRLCGDDTLAEIAISHANTTLANHFRDDWTSWHLLDYDPAYGKVRYRETVQGYAHGSAWARGQAWALYGYTMMYRETGKKEYLQAAENIGRMLISKLPDDGIPYWDFNSPGTPEQMDSTAAGATLNKSAYLEKPLRDASAGAIMSSAFIELSTLTEDKEASREFLDTALRQILTLGSEEYLAEPGTNGCFILKHSVGNIPADGEIDVPLSYADYYFLEALLRYSVISHLE